ncbi:MAG: bifunctional DNA primase/polymerase, partial [Acidimicrobiales bacterium]
MTRAGDSNEANREAFGEAAFPTYAAAAALWRKRGWWPFPLPAGRKKEPPKGVTGWKGRDPTDMTLDYWSRESAPDSNLALLLPPGVIGLDLDCHKDETARARLEEFLGCELTDTICSTSRSDGSGIYLYKVPVLPEGERWNTAPVEAVEVVQRTHRYCVTWPSMHPEGNRYRLIDTRTGETLEAPPDFDDLTELPTVAVEALRARNRQYAQRDPVNFKLSDGEMSARVAQELAAALKDLRTVGGRHDRTRDHTCT